ncbi:putative polygalacturonase-like [Dorcoceras hygrometricum]|uniref:Putative polygalacturonase-like n=1 Tax=Dorcoceras hygrometricum TaxID=472368 RepID=A0A2Z7D3P5_9LAMI|nr:putative polygalacturonase-like [Dorcoceras hygrometricum]
MFRFFTFALITSCIVAASLADSAIFNVLDYGAIGDGQADDTKSVSFCKAFAEAWEATCGSSSSSPTMHVPWGKAFLIHPISFKGPCKSKGVNIEIDGDVTAPSGPSEWRCGGDGCERWIHIESVDGLNVGGQGMIDGRGDKWWQAFAFEIAKSNNVTLGGGLRFKNSPRMQVVLYHLNSVRVSNVIVEAPEDSPNTDGIHVSACTDAFIDRSIVGTGNIYSCSQNSSLHMGFLVSKENETGDDCISIVDGSSFVTISNIICGPGHGISIGSLGKHGANSRVENIKVSDVVFIGTQNGARIKTWQGGKGYARNILFERILSHESRNTIVIDQFYCDHEQCGISDSAVQISNVTYRQVLGTSKGQTAVKLFCSKAVPCKNIVVEDIELVSSNDDKKATFECNNVYGRAQGRRVPNNPCLNLM